ncbi:hypothetical protein [Variovorax sp. YR216]|uniref:hypothetical protein n=1 Tax=Variovorax sp. YR216 TaxID=1882828 RepID=UPI0008966A69|nr:hypothetical protein [Variovorax sp. YR216]SEB26362.1 hypothetical protein SAMN05444680_13142 [Variovorax sp. YR216]
MKHKAARREVLGAIAEFQQVCLDFSSGMQKVLEVPAVEPAPPLPLLDFGPRKPAKRASRRQLEPARASRQ